MPTPTLLDRELLLDAGEDLAEELVAAGLAKAKVGPAVAPFLDAILPLDLLIPGPLGIVAEELDGAALARAVEYIDELFRADPEQRAERKAKRAARRTARQEARAARRLLRDQL